MGSIYDTDLDRNAANHVPLSPISFLTRTARAYPEKLAVIHGDIRRNWGEVYERSVRLASALSKRGVKRGDTVAVMAPNIPAFVDAHFGVPMSGAVLNALNIRLDAEAIAFILKHGEAKVILVDREFSSVIAQAVEALETKPLIIDIDDPLAEHGDLIGEIEYEAFLKEGDPDFEFHRPTDEWDAIALNYTSGTTGDPKGVVTHHRGAYLNALGNAMEWDLPHFPVYLWTLPMFHCNGWCFPWTLAVQAGTHVCLRMGARQGDV
jgi:fatty-acyl-CoA synthase